MISSQSRTKEWIMGIRKIAAGRDPILIEKMIMALTLVENLQLSGLDFIFKGGTSLILLLGKALRFSIDIDIILSHPRSLDPFFNPSLSKAHFTVMKKTSVQENYQSNIKNFFFIQ